MLLRNIGLLVPCNHKQKRQRITQGDSCYEDILLVLASILSLIQQYLNTYLNNFCLCMLRPECLRRCSYTHCYKTIWFSV